MSDGENFLSGEVHEGESEHALRTALHAVCDHKRTALLQVLVGLQPDGKAGLQVVVTAAVPGQRGADIEIEAARALGPTIERILRAVFREPPPGETEASR